MTSKLIANDLEQAILNDLLSVDSKFIVRYVDKESIIFTNETYPGTELRFDLHDVGSVLMVSSDEFDFKTKFSLSEDVCRILIDSVW